MQTKLTLRLEEALIRKAKRFSKRSGKSVSMIVADYFEKLNVPAPEEIKAITPKALFTLDVYFSCRKWQFKRKIALFSGIIS